MISLTPRLDGRPLRVLCLGAHSDDIEIGCGGALLRWASQHAGLDVRWVVFSAQGERSVEARESARGLLPGLRDENIVIGDFEDSRLPDEFGRAKAFVGAVRADFPEPDVVFTHRLEDRHQDHRLVAELTWQTWRNHLILEYEIPKYEGDLGQPNVFVPIDDAVRRRKVDHLLNHFGSQRSKSWFDATTFDAMLRLRGVECRADSGFAEAFHARKLILQHQPT